MKSDGMIVVLSYPDTVVRPAYTEFSSKIWPLVGIGTKDAVQAGHAALLLINVFTLKVEYFDFGRYITSFGMGRVRSYKTDAELTIPIKAVIDNGVLKNIDEILLWLSSHPEKTHGEGRLVASVNKHIAYQKAKDFIDFMVTQKEIPYGAFVKNGSNCARFVTDTVINSCNQKNIRFKLKTSNLFTPSPIGNAIKATTEDEIYVVENHQVKQYANRSVLKEYFSCFLNKMHTNLDGIGTELPNKKVFDLPNGTWLGGIGSGAWFCIVGFKDGVYKIKRYTANGENDFKGDFKLQTEGFNMHKAYKIVHPTNCFEVFVQQEQHIYMLQCIS